jgi:hypothetical protein
MKKQRASFGLLESSSWPGIAVLRTAMPGHDDFYVEISGAILTPPCGRARPSDGLSGRDADSPGAPRHELTAWRMPCL